MSSVSTFHFVKTCSTFQLFNRQIHEQRPIISLFVYVSFIHEHDYTSVMHSSMMPLIVVFQCFMLVTVCMLGLFQAFGDGLVVFVFLRCVLCLPIDFPIRFQRWVSAFGFCCWAFDWRQRSCAAKICQELQELQEL